MKQKFFLISVFSIGFLFGFWGQSLLSEIMPPPSHSPIQQTIFSAESCSGITDETYIIRGKSMLPLFSDGTEIQMEKNYYQCEWVNPKRDDIVIYQSNTTDGPIIKKLLVLWWDRVSFDSQGRMLVNNTKLINSQGQEYIFTKQEQQVLNLYIKDGILRSGAYFIFGDNVRESFDSRKFWAVGMAGFIGRVKK